LEAKMDTREVRRRILEGRHHDPFTYLGMHACPDGVSVRVFHPWVTRVRVVGLYGEGAWDLEKQAPEGLFESAIPGRREAFGYTLEFTSAEGFRWTQRDPYSFLPVIGDFDLHLFNEGTNYQIYEKFGAHVMDLGGVRGTLFAVWAPNAQRVSVVGGFNRWDGRVHQMRCRGSSGVWEIFLPGVAPGDVYKYEIRGPGGEVFLKSDPCAFLCEKRPRTGSIVWGDAQFEWGDADYLWRRGQGNVLHRPMSIYEVHLGSWARVPATGEMLSYRDLAHRLAAYVKDLGFTHIELLPIAEHPLDESWGYQVSGYFAPTSRFGPPEDFMYFVDCMHRHDIGVIVDWVPAHFPKDGHGLAWFDGTALYEHGDPRQGEHRDWGTKVFNFGRNEVRSFLLSNAVFWLDRFHVDGLRVDAVASMLYLDYSRPPREWIPNKYGGRENLDAITFLARLNESVHGRFPGAVTIAEESTAWPGVSRPTYLGGLGFTMKWNMGWMHDMLEFFSKDPLYRKYHHEFLTFAMLYAFHENFILPLSHDEVVHGKAALLAKMPGDVWQKFANLRLLLSYMYGQPGKKLLFQGGEFGQWSEWNSGASLDWHLCAYAPHRGLTELVRRLNQLHREEPAFHDLDFDGAGFRWIDFGDTDNSVVSFLRSGRGGGFVLCAFNCTPVPRADYRIGVPEEGWYREILNSDSEIYGGSNLGNAGGVRSEPIPWHNQPHSLRLTLPPLGALYLKLEA
jgi:1,4-alpha-glucan branching enzyme